MFKRLLLALLLMVNIFNSSEYLARSYQFNPINPKILKEAMTDYYTHSHLTNIIGIVDFNLPSTEKRLWIINADTQEILFNTYVTHGENSGQLYAVRFSNQNGSKESALGTYEVKDEYFGKHGRSKRLDGLDSSNSMARKRAIVLHGANYIGEGRTGRSWGCPAVPTKDLNQVLNLLSYGSLLILLH